MTQILIIEDEDALREEVVDTLGFEGFDVIAAENGRVGVDLARAYHPDLIICDIMMPELDGYGVFEELSQAGTTMMTPFIFLTAKAEREDWRYGMELGADDYIVKPFQRSELLNAIHTRLRMRAAIGQQYTVKLEHVINNLTRLVTHELRTPVTSMTMIQDIIARQVGQVTPDQLEELLESMGSGSRRLSHLVEQIVLITHLDSGSISQESISRDGFPKRIADLLAAAVPLARRFSYLNPDTEIRMDIRHGEVIVTCDMAALKHALAELISNALNFSPSDSEVVVSQWQTGDILWVTIDDQGEGIAQGKLQQALEAFQQIDRETREQQGMGLGTFVAHRIIEAHGGTLELKSELGKGTQVIVSLPVAGN